MDIKLTLSELTMLCTAAETQMIEDSKRLEFWESVTTDEIKDEYATQAEMVDYFRRRIATMKSAQTKLRESPLAD